MSLRETDTGRAGVTYVCHHAVDDHETGPYGDADGDHIVYTADLVQIAGEGPRCRVGVVRLDGRAAPGAVAVGVTKLVAVAADDGDHDGVVDEAAEDGAVHLREEHDSRRDLQVLAHLEILGQIHGVGDDVVGPGGEVHVAHGSVRHH